MLVRSLPSTAGNLSPACICTILPLVTPTSTDSVPLPVMGPPNKPVPWETLVTVPEVTAAGSHIEPFHFSTSSTLGATFPTVRVCNFTALMLVKSLPSTAGSLSPACICTILPLVTPTSIFKVTLPVVLPATSPVPLVTVVTGAEGTAVGSQREPFHISTSLALGATAATSRVCSLTALILVKSLPSTAGSLSPACICTILPLVTPTSTLRVTLPVGPPPNKPAPTLTSVISPPAFESAEGS